MNDALNRLLRFLLNEQFGNGLLKAGIALCSLGLLSISQLGPGIVERDLAAHKMKFDIEQSLDTDSIESVDCAAAGKERAACHLAKYHLSTTATTLKLWDDLFRFSTGPGVACIAFGAFLFAARVWSSTQLTKVGSASALVESTRR